ncbi:MAG: translation initiation factor IF-2 [Victivallaceae bacterium]|nr:translation initiation factor IF-2 [Victivallaceae bacterium]
MKKVKVKDLANRYKMSPKAVMKELDAEGIEVKNINSTIPADMLELVEVHMRDLANSKAKAIEAKKEVAAKEKALKNIDSSSLTLLRIKPPIIVKSLAEEMEKQPNEIISALISIGVFASINQTVPEDKAAEICLRFGYELEVDRRHKEEHDIHRDFVGMDDDDDDEQSLIDRAPVVTFLGHVDHGKTSLQDRVRQTSVVDGEAGKITQHIGASTVTFKDKMITFIDTPGHAAFTKMRARGANVTDIAILVVAADDGFMPQTIEAMNHARAADVPIIVAINKMDLSAADPDKIILQMQQNELMSEDWGGDVGTVRVSAETGEGIDDLLDRILLETELLELKGNPNRRAKGVVIEANLEQGLGATANILVQNGTLRIGDVVLCGEYYGKVRAMFNFNENKIEEAGPSTPAKLVGLSGTPEAGATFMVCKNEREARDIANARAIDNRNQQLATTATESIDDLFSKINDAQATNLKLIIKSDVRGSGEAIADSLNKLPSDKIKIDVVMSGVGAITDNDVMLAAASDALIVGFHVRVNPGVNAIAKRSNVEIRLYSIIYELIEEIKDALTGLLAPVKREKDLGTAKILQIFAMRKGPKICGCMVDKGSIKVGAKARVIRNKELIFNGEINSLRRFTDDVKEVKAGLECGIRLDNFMDFVEGDIISVYDIEFEKDTL